MLTPTAYRILSRLRQKRDWKAIRLFIFLMGEYDLRNYVALSARELATQFGGHRVNVRQALTRLVRVGLFEQGPSVLRRPTFRIRPAFLMTTKALRAQTQWLQEREERMSVAPEETPRIRV